jgi:hypothetical protein
VQTCVKDTVGVGREIIVDFFAEFDEQGKAEYSYFKEMPEDLSLLEQAKFQLYAEKQTLKICHYLQHVRRIEVLKMRVEFFRDQNDNVWLSNCSGIHVRKQLSSGLMSPLVGEINDRVKFRLKEKRDLRLREQAEFEITSPKSYKDPSD